MEDQVSGTPPTAISVSPAPAAGGFPSSGAMIAITAIIALAIVPSRPIAACASVASALFACAPR